MPTRTITKTTQGANGAPLSATYILTGNDEENFEETLAIGTAVVKTYEFGHSSLLAFFALATMAATVAFYNATTLEYTLTLQAGIPFDWDTDCGFASPFTADITSIKVTNAAAGQLDLSALLSI